MKKKISNLFTPLCALLIIACSPKNTTTKSFKIWGNCDMCKETIENACQIKGVKTANWNTQSKIMTIDFDTLQTTVEEVQQHIASAGYDTELYTADSAAYHNLHECCQYERKSGND